MTPLSPPDPIGPSHRARTAGRRAFTLVELLVVIGIILVLISLLLPAINRAHRQAVRASMLADFSVISQALDQYRDDFGDYPRTGAGNNTTGGNVPIYGATVLCWALVAPGPAIQDGAGATSGTDKGAPGFRIRPTGQGKVYGPYISLDRFKIGRVATSAGNPSIAVFTPASTATWDDSNTVLGDRYGNVILYYPSAKGSVPANSYVGNYSPKTPPAPPLPTYNYGDNSIFTQQASPISPAVTSLTQRMFEYKLGNISMSGKINPSTGEVPVMVPYILWSAGPDSQFGPQVGPNSSNQSITTGEDDDVVYPDQLLTIPAGQKP